MGIRLPAAAAAAAAAPLSQVSKLVFLLLLFLLAPFLPSFLRVPYFYLLFNVIVLALGIQAGLLRNVAAASSAPRSAADDFPYKSSGDHHHQGAAPTSIVASTFQRAKSVVQRPNGDVLPKVVAVADDHEVSAFGSTNSIDPKKIVKKTLTVLLKKCPSRASIFFLCAVDRGQVTSEKEQDQEQEAYMNADVDEDDVTMSRQELFARTESFLGNFRKQLRMQRG